MASPTKKTRRRSAPQPTSLGAGPSDHVMQPCTATHAAITRRLSASPSDGSGHVQHVTPQQRPQATALPPLLTLPPLPEDKDEYGRLLHPDHLRYHLKVGDAVHCSLLSPYRSPPLQLTLMLDALLAHDSYTLLYRVHTLQPHTEYALRILLSGQDLGLQGAAADCHDFQMEGVCAEELATLAQTYGNSSYINSAVQAKFTPFAPVGRVMVHGRHALLLMGPVSATLHQSVAGGRPLPMPVFRDITKQLLQILALSETLRIPHGNLSASNVLLREVPSQAPQASTSGSADTSSGSSAAPRYQVILIGFAAKVWFAGGNGVPGRCTMIGPYSRFAPEMDDGHAHTPAADMYQLGMLLVEMLTGVNPYEWLRAKGSLDDNTPAERHLELFSWMKEEAAYTLFDVKPGNGNPLCGGLPARACKCVKPLLASFAPARTTLQVLQKSVFLTPPVLETHKRKRATETQKSTRRKPPPLDLDDV